MSNEETPLKVAFSLPRALTSDISGGCDVTCAVSLYTYSPTTVDSTSGVPLIYVYVGIPFLSKVPNSEIFVSSL